MMLPTSADLWGAVMMAAYLVAGMVIAQFVGTNASLAKIPYIGKYPYFVTALVLIVVGMFFMRKTMWTIAMLLIAVELAQIIYGYIAPYIPAGGEE